LAKVDMPFTPKSIARCAAAKAALQLVGR